MKQRFLTIGATLALVLPFALSSYAYKNPTVAPTGNNNEIVPIYINATPQVKTGNLSVYAFEARANALLSQKTFFVGAIEGGGVGGTNTSTVTVGESGHGANALVTGSVSVDGTIESKTLTHSDTTLKKICADSTGTFILCP